MGRLIPAGTGLAYHAQRRKDRQAEEELSMSAADVEAALTEALSADTDADADTAPAEE